MMTLDSKNRSKLFPHRYNPDVEISHTMPAPYYWDTDIFELEKELFL